MQEFILAIIIFPFWILLLFIMSNITIDNKYTQDKIYDRL